MEAQYIKLLTAGAQYINLGKHEDALKCINDSLTITQQKGDQNGVAVSYLTLGECYRTMSMHNEALKNYEKCLDIFVDLGNKIGEVRTCSNIGIVYIMLSKYDDAKEYLNRGLKIAQEVESRESECECYLYLGDLHRHLAQFDESLKCAKLSLKIAEKIDSLQGKGLAYQRLGDAYDSLGRTHEAIDYYQRFLQYAKQSIDKINECKAYNGLATSYCNIQDYDKATSCAEKSVEIAKETSDLTTEGKAYAALGDVLFYQGKNKEAIECHMKHLEITKKMDDKSGEARAYNCLGSASVRLGNNYDAMKYYKSSIDLYSQLDLKNDVGKVNGNLGILYYSLGKLNEAMQCYQMSLETAHNEHSKKNTYYNLGNIYSKLNMPLLAMECRLKFIILAVQTGDKRGEIRYYLELGDCFVNQGELDEAIKYHKKALVMALEINDSTRCAYWKVATTYYRLGKWEEAIEFSEICLKIASDSGDKNDEAIFRSDIGVLYWNLSHYHKERNDDDKYTQTIQHAERYLRESLRCWNELFDDLREYHHFKISIADTFLSLYMKLTSVLIETNQTEEALVISECGRARALKDTLVSKYELNHVFATTSLREEPLNESDFLNIVPNNVCLLFCTFTFTNSLLFWVLSTQKKPLIYIENKLPQNCSTKKIDSIYILYITKVVDIAYQSMKVRKMAPNCEDRSFGNAKCIDEEDGKQPQLKTSMDYVQPRLDKSLEEFIDSEYLSLSHFRGNESKSVEPEQRVECKEPLKELFKQLITPVQQHLTEDEIVIVPEGPLYSVPFAALQDPQTGRFLSETKRIRLAPSLTTLKLLKDCPADYHSKTGALFVGNPHVGEVMFRGEKITFQNLPKAEDEATVLSRVFRVEPALTGIHATKDAVKEKLREGPALIHIAAHGDDSNGQIALAPGISAQSKPIPEEEDYILTMKEVQEIGVRAQLVVLSCCHSGRGEIRAEGVVGMSRAFLAAGARAVVASLWSIDDYATLEFMASFYKYLRYGDSASLSLKNAMEELRGNRRYNEPKYWAPFFLIGDDVTILKI